MIKVNTRNEVCQLPLVYLFHERVIVQTLNQLILKDKGRQKQTALTASEKLTSLNRKKFTKLFFGSLRLSSMTQSLDLLQPD